MKENLGSGPPVPLPRARERKPLVDPRGSFGGAGGWGTRDKGKDGNV